MTAGVQLMRNVFTSLAKIVLVPLRLKAALSAINAAVWKRIFNWRQLQKKIPKIPGQGVKELVKKYFELVKGQLEQVRIFNAARFFNQFWNTKILSKRT